MTYDLVVIGGGPAGEKSAAAAAYFGKKVVIVEASAKGPGGAAVHTGTLPSKTLRETALYITGFQRRELYKGMDCVFQRTGHSVQDLMCRLPQIRQHQTRQIKDNLERHGIDLIEGRAAFIGPGEVQVGERRVEGKNFLIATGSSPRRPAQFDFTDSDVYDSDSILLIDEIPETLAVVGGGVIGSEYACVFATLGVRIQIIERGPTLMRFLDHEISDALMASMSAKGIELHLNTAVESLERRRGKLCLTLKSGKEMRVDKVLVSAGRVGNTAGMDLDKAGVKVDDSGLCVVDEHFRTSASHVFAAGDVIGRPALASTSMEQGRVAVSEMFGLKVPGRDWKNIPAGIYTIPEAASVGPTEEELIAAKVPYVIGRSLMRHNARGQLIGDTDGLVKLIFHAETRKLLATHLICEWATELIHVGQSVMRLGGGIDYFVESVMTYPSLSDAYKYAAYDALGRLNRGVERPAPLS